LWPGIEFNLYKILLINWWVTLKHLIINNNPLNWCSAVQKWPVWKKLWNKGAAKKWLWWYRLMVKISIATIQVNLCCLIPASLGISSKFIWIVVIKIFAINLYYHSHFLAAPFLFSHWFLCCRKKKRASRCGDNYIYILLLLHVLHSNTVTSFFL